MYMMTYRQNIYINGCNPFMLGAYNPRMNFFMGMAAGLAGIPIMPVVPMYNFSMMNPFATMGYVNQGSIMGFGGGYNYSIPTYATSNYSTPILPSFSSVPRPTLTMPNLNPFGSLTGIGAASSPSPESNQGASTSVNNEASGPVGRRLNKRQGYGKEFLDKVKAIAKRVNCNYRDLLAVMNSESGIRTDAVNKNGGATGLIQFMPKTAQGLGTSTTALRNMTPLQQLDYVEKYILVNKRMAGFGENERLSGGQLYALIFLPGRAKREALTTSNEAYYKANKGLDANKDGKITRAELDARVRSHYVSDNSFIA